MATNDSYSSLDLRQMDEQTARNTLTVNEFERWEKLHDLAASAEQTRERWAEEDDRVADIVVHADDEQLGTEVDLFGNDVLVRVDPDDDEFKAVAESLDATFGDREVGDTEALDDAAADEIVTHLLEMLDIVLLRWNGTAWADLAEDQRADVLSRARRKWSLDGLLLAWFDIAEAVNADREERVDVIESFRGSERRGRR